MDDDPKEPESVEPQDRTEPETEPELPPMMHLEFKGAEPGEGTIREK